MRYVVLVIMSVVGTILSGSVFSGLNIAGIQVDIVLLLILALSLAEKDAMPVIFAAATGLLMDLVYSDTLGMFALSYTAAAVAALLTVRKIEKINLPSLFAAGFSGYVIKELTMALIVFAQGARFDLGAILLRYTLPAAALNGGLLIVAYWLVMKLYRNAWMRPRIPRAEDF